MGIRRASPLETLWIHFVGRLTPLIGSLDLSSVETTSWVFPQEFFHGLNSQTGKRDAVDTAQLQQPRYSQGRLSEMGNGARPRQTLCEATRARLEP
jgi:hypothetical protein